MDWDKTVEAAKRGEWMTIRSGDRILAEGESYMDGEILCIKCDPLTAKGVARYVRITVADRDYLDPVQTRDGTERSETLD